jgi:hypothetical protein
MLSVVCIFILILNARKYRLVGIYIAIENMNTYLLLLFFFFIAGCASQQDNGEKFLKSALPGKWKEDQDKRKNLDEYLTEMGKKILLH